MNAEPAPDQPPSHRRKPIQLKFGIGLAAILFLCGLLIFSAQMLVLLRILDREAIHQAAREGDVREVARILDNSPERLESRDRGGETPVHVATEYGQVEVLELPIRRGADVNAKWDLAASGNSGWNALHIASNCGRIESARVLIRAGADINCKTEKGETPLDIAFRNGHQEIADLLKSHGAVWGVFR